MAAPNVFTISASAPFAETLAEGVIARYGATPLSLADVTIFLPTRRAARTFGDAFARKLGGAALLPAFRALGDVDDEESAFDDSQLDIPPAIAPLRRRLLLATLVRRWLQNKRSEPVSFMHAVAYADGLAALLDEIETQRSDLEKLDGLVDGALAEHWQEVSDFLSLLRNEWPKILDEQQTLNRAERRNRALAALAVRLQAGQRHVIAAGSTGSIPATADLLATIASLPNGAVVLPGLDRSLDEEGWESIAHDPAHPQFGLKQLIEHIGVLRNTVRDWTENAERNVAREFLLGETLRPAPTTDAWRRVAEGSTATIAKGMEGLSLVEAADPAEEAAAIALILREALEAPRQTAALVTPDRKLARRVSQELQHFGVEIDDSAGRPLAATPSGAFLCLLADAVSSRFAPVPLLALLKHPLAVAEDERVAFLRRTRELDLALRGPRGECGLQAIARKLSTNAALSSWFEKVASPLRALEQVMAQPEVALVEIINSHVEAAERLSSQGSGQTALWKKDSGAAASALFASFREAARDLPAIEPSAYAQLFRRVTQDVLVRPAFGTHPRLAILGPLEARLQNFDVVVLGGLNEGTWPGAVAADPWLSRPMRADIGLEQPERAIGLSAHDFASLTSRPCVIFTRATKIEGAQTIASRWLQRLTQLARGMELEAALAPRIAWLDIARRLRAVSEAIPVTRPAPTPPVSTRPRALSVTEIETWRRDPYAIYARRVLKLDAREALDAEFGPLERGKIVHEALELFVKQHPDELPDDAVSRLIAIADALFRQNNIPKPVLAVWRPRFAHAADWFVEKEREQRDRILASHAEVKGELILDGPAGPFRLHGKADRIDLLRDGGASIIDYKTGEPPSKKQLENNLAPQLPLEGAIAAAGGFEGLARVDASELVYVRFGGGAKPGEWRVIKLDTAKIVAETLARLVARVALYDQQPTGYVSRAIPMRSDIHGDYDRLARVGEWVNEADEDMET